MSEFELGVVAGCAFMTVWHFGSNFVMGAIEAHRGHASNDGYSGGSKVTQTRFPAFPSAVIPRGDR